MGYEDLSNTQIKKCHALLYVSFLIAIKCHLSPAAYFYEGYCSYFLSQFFFYIYELLLNITAGYIFIYISAQAKKEEFATQFSYSWPRFSYIQDDLGSISASNKYFVFFKIYLGSALSSILWVPGLCPEYKSSGLIISYYLPYLFGLKWVERYLHVSCMRSCPFG